MYICMVCVCVCMCIYIYVLHICICISTHYSDRCYVKPKLKDLTKNCQVECPQPEATPKPSTLNPQKP